jgi:hypothetical protein
MTRSFAPWGAPAFSYARNTHGGIITDYTNVTSSPISAGFFICHGKYERRCNGA